MGEVDKMSGSVSVSGSLAYAAQSSFVMNMTLRVSHILARPLLLALCPLPLAPWPVGLSCCLLTTCCPQDNVLFGSEYNAVKYNEVLAACALTDDLDQLPAGDMTQIGERGINLSGVRKNNIQTRRNNRKSTVRYRGSLQVSSQSAVAINWVIATMSITGPSDCRLDAEQMSCGDRARNSVSAWRVRCTRTRMFTFWMTRSARWTLTPASTSWTTSSSAG